MTTRRSIRIHVELPELTAEQADLLWNFLDDLASQLWDEYAGAILDRWDEYSPPGSDQPPTGDDYNAYLEKRSAPDALPTNPNRDQPL